MMSNINVVQITERIRGTKNTQSTWKTSLKGLEESLEIMLRSYHCLKNPSYEL